MWKYIVYWSVVSVSQVDCPDEKWGKGCDEGHTIETVDNFHERFVHESTADWFINNRMPKDAVRIKKDKIN